MAVRHALLYLVDETPSGVYPLRSAFTARTGGTWPLNIGQVHTTLQRLVRDGLVVSSGEAPLEAPDRTAVYYSSTPAGHEEAARWIESAVERSTPERDELVIKLALAATSPGADVARIIQTQRRETMRALHEYTRMKTTAPQPTDGADSVDLLTWELILDRQIFAAEAEVRWLDHVEARVLMGARALRKTPASRATLPAPAGDTATAMQPGASA